MSATAETLAEELRELDKKLVIAKSSADVDLVEDLNKKRKLILEQLVAANQALNEGSCILKG